MRCAGFQTTLVRATEWLAREKVTTNIPADFPTSGRTSVRDKRKVSKFHSFTMNDIDGKAVSLSDYQGKVILVVNVASKCGFTKQYAPLQRLYEKYKDRGFVILGFPANNFLWQEPGTDT
ncbi:MAG: redoxin domain-containing protein, partial [Anaerohalosphaera sp.]|nr:redoxin domain-containing protein [Anaerohalosphaera sp.]